MNQSRCKVGDIGQKEQYDQEDVGNDSGGN